MSNFTILILPIHKHKRSLHLLMSFFVSFYNFISLSFHYLDKVLDTFEAIMNGIVSLIYFSVHLSSLYRKRYWFFLWILYPDTFLNALVSYSFPMAPVGSLCIKPYHTQRRRCSLPLILFADPYLSPQLQVDESHLHKTGPPQSERE